LVQAMAGEVERSLEGGVLTLTLARPDARNALSLALINELKAALHEAAGDKAVRCVVITGKGSAFCAGGDVREMQERAGKAVATKERLQGGLNQVARSIFEMEKPVVAKVNGDAAGAGFNLALACDIVYAADTATFHASFIKVGLIPDVGGSWTLPRRVGLHRAKEMLFLGESVAAPEAERMGLINRAVPAAELDNHVKGVAAILAAQPTKTIGLAKRAMHRGLASTFEEALEHEAYAQGYAFTTQDHVEGTKAFLEKRPPNFKGE
jgi:enoyl-CoA hydratase/carnithine racemase